MKRKNKIIPLILGPIPIVVVFVIVCVWIIFSPVDIIDGKSDNAPHRAAMILVFLMPFIYLLFLIVLTLQVKVTRLFNRSKFSDHIFASMISAIFISCGNAYIIFEPKFNESFLIIWLISFIVYGILIFSMTFLWWALTHRDKKENSQQIV